MRVFIDFGGFYCFHDEVINYRIDMEFESFNETLPEAERETLAMFEDRVDYKATYDDYADAWLNEFASWFNIDIKFVGVDSPRYYNYRTDLIEAEISQDEAWSVINANISTGEFMDWIGERDDFKIRDGYFPTYDSFEDLLYQAKQDEADLAVLFRLICEYLIDGEAAKYDVEFEISYND